jgi:putative addiction module killer protein
VKPFGGGICELRIDYGPGYRVYYLHEGERLILLLCGGDKSTQSADIAAARGIAQQWRANQGGDR